MAGARPSVLRAGSLGIVAALAVSTARAELVLYVDDDAPRGGDGLTWATAYDDLRAALAVAAQTGGTVSVRVAGGRYVPTVDSGNPRTASFNLSSGVSLLGGFAGLGGGDPDVRDPALFPSVLSGDRNGDDGPGFVNNGENCYHVVVGSGADASAVLDGFLISGGNANGPINPESRGGGIRVAPGGPTLSNCAVVGNAALVGGGLFLEGEMTITGCLIADNYAEVVAGCMVGVDSNVTMRGCDVTGNTALVGVGGIQCTVSSAIRLLDCTLTDNEGGLGPGGGLLIDAVLVNCFVARNTAQFLGGGLTVNDCDLVNCVFSRNSAGKGGGVAVDGVAHVVNCTFSQNEGGGIADALGQGTAIVHNSILWANTPDQIDVGSVSHSDVQGGWPGEGNIDADPLFVQPGTDDVRLTFASPCLDIGDNNALPADEFDIDGDGDVLEVLPADLDGGPRVEAGVVDLGACEGGHEGLPPGDSESNVDQGETVVLTFGASVPDPTSVPLVVLTNTGGPDNGTVLAVLHEDELHPGAGGFSDLGSILEVETSFNDGQFLMVLTMPFGPDHLGGAEPFDVDLTHFNESSGRWSLAVTGNTAPSPGHAGPVGDRVRVLGPAPFSFPSDLGDYGIWWDPATARGIVWAVVDHASDFGFGVNLCPADGAPLGGDGAVGVQDLVGVVLAWSSSAAGSVFDINRDGAVDAADLLAVIDGWGMCRE